MLLLSARGPARWPQRIGPARADDRRAAARGRRRSLLLRRIGPGARYAHRRAARRCWSSGSGWSLTVAPLTATVLAAAPGPATPAPRPASTTPWPAPPALLAVAVVPALAGLSGASTSDTSALQHGFPTAMLIGAAALLLGAVVSWFGLGREARVQRASDSSAEPVSR